MLDLSSATGRTEFGNRIKNARTRRGLTQEMLGELLYCNRSTVSQWERGENLPEYGTIAALCATLDCDVGYLFGVYDEINNVTHTIVELTGLSEDAVGILDGGNRYSEEFVYFIDEMICEYSEILSEAYFSIRAASNCKRIANRKRRDSHNHTNEADELFSGSDIDVDALVFSLLQPFDNGDKIKIPEGTMLLSSEDASAFYVDKVVGMLREMVVDIVEKHSAIY